MAQQFKLVRDVTPKECDWLATTIPRDAVVYECHKATYGCISPIKNAPVWGRWLELGCGQRQPLRQGRDRATQAGGVEPSDGHKNVAYSYESRSQGWQIFTQRPDEWAAGKGGLGGGSGHDWGTEPDVGRVVARLSSRVDRLRCLGNAVVPQVAEYVGGCIMEKEWRLSERRLHDALDALEDAQ